MAVLLAASAQAGIYDAAVLADNPFAYYRFEDGAGPTATDSSGNGNNGTYFNIALGQASAAPNLGSSGGFSLADNRLDVPVLGSYPQHTVELWIYATSLGGLRSMFSTDAWGSNRLHYNLNGAQVEHAMAAPTQNVNTGNIIVTGQWYHIVSTYDAGNNGDVETYVNGVNQNVGTHNHTQPINMDSGGEIGTWTSSREVQGFIDEVAFYDSVLTPAEVQAHYDAAFIPEPSTFLLAAMGLLGLAFVARRKR